ncbi:GTP cyclohydrolase II [Fervidobacterium pennivorans DSM 9078]|jgi:3,4-dihydroxy 2-butanone 4-phosphate synthase/GTP cyclohydrolase II|uniref:GTP cyclohydrolase-2 n=1 Tax=Fervidobacterium pennivorans (strain DSM 9078 / Ven5) TaxID=771875 RepID=H9UBM2_FERPD|nr:bifunctional 3,4-dihydroxy-2-butanone-4-phosphate synthase/GTP cyclohydrolase II [Fervidobacterium pennivorans]AFG34915.1 GTP cyclohydrolase II [Fervidobacterium pennivorans DSM 9078]QIV78180.1 bifunctional 3,4-dihydroxy-2-butanone-4-phosphate synthase/GTP cyclohydrolase II [Fervidobacterium pennivorans subsp. keratinolyticus]
MDEEFVQSIRDDFLNGKPVVVIDEEREIEADFVFPAELMDERITEFFVRYGKGLFCVVGPEENLLKRGFFRLPSNYGANYFVPIDWGTGTGISTIERATTCNKISDETTTLQDFKYPGHVTLIGAKEFTTRRGHSESSVELVRLLGFKPFSCIVEILDETGNSHNLEYVKDLAKHFKLKVITINQIWKLYVKHEKLIEVKAVARLPTEYGEFEIYAFDNKLDGKEHVAIVRKWPDQSIPLVRIHSECFTGDTLSSLRCDCGSQLSSALKRIAENGGILIYLRQEGRGIGLTNKIKAYSLQDKGIDTYEANVKLGFKPDERDYAAAYQILKSLGVQRIVLLTNNPEKVKQLEDFGISVERTERLFGRLTEHNKFYLKTKMVRFNHLLEGIEGLI